MDQPSEVANPARGQLNREKYLFFSLFPFMYDVCDVCNNRAIRPCHPININSHSIIMPPALLEFCEATPIGLVDEW